MRKINLFGKQISVLVLSLLLLAGIGSATLLYTFATQTQRVTVSQAITSNMPETLEYTIEVVGGETHSEGPYDITSHTTVPVILKFERTVDPEEDEEGITTTYTNRLRLENKNICASNDNSPTCWQVIDDEKKADLMFNIVGETFDYSLNAEGLNPETEYVLIYYADQQNRFENWGGNNPGAEIERFTTDSSGNKQVSGSVELGMNLPAEQDWNANPSPDYCDKHNNYDDYNHCRGAKIWLVPASDYDAGNKKVTWSNPSRYLFETDMTRYFDNSENELVIPAGDLVGFYITNQFDVALTGDYTITIDIVPQGEETSE